MVPMSAAMPQRFIKHDRCLDFTVPVLAMNHPPEIDNLIPNYHALGMQKCKARPFILKTEQIHLPANHTVIPLSGLFNPGNMFIQLFFIAPDRAINPLQHFLACIPMPVRPRHRHNLNCLRVNRPRPRNMRSPAQIHKSVALPVKTNHIPGRTVDIVQFIHISCHFLTGFIAIHLDTFKWPVGFDNLGHLRFDFREIFRPDGSIQVHIIIKAIGNRRSIHQAGIRPQTAYRLGHNMRTAMAQYLYPFGVFIRNDLQAHFTSNGCG